jgi:hypothetical protein
MTVLFTDRSLYHISVRLNSRWLRESFKVFNLIRQQEYLSQYNDQATSGRFQPTEVTGVSQSVQWPAYVWTIGKQDRCIYFKGSSSQTNVQAIQLILSQYSQCSSSPVSVHVVQSTLNPIKDQAIQSMLKQYNQCSSSSINAQADQPMQKQFNRRSRRPIYVQAVQSMLY